MYTRKQPIATEKLLYFQQSFSTCVKMFFVFRKKLRKCTLAPEVHSRNILNKINRAYGLLKRFAPRCNGLAANYQKLRNKKKTLWHGLKRVKTKKITGSGTHFRKRTQRYFLIFFFSHDNNGMEQTPERSCYQSISLYY